MGLRAVLFDVDFTICRPGPAVGPEGYRALGERHGLALDPARYEEARQAAVGALRRHPELHHDDEIWIEFTVDIVVGMGGTGHGARACAEEMVRMWEHSHHFDLYEDARPVLSLLRTRGLRLGLLSNTGRDLDHFAEHHELDVDAVLGSRVHGRTKPHPSIFEAALARVGAPAEEAVMVGDSLEDDIAGALGIGMEAILLDRDDRHPEVRPRIRDLWSLPGALGLPA